MGYVWKTFTSVDNMGQTLPNIAMNWITGFWIMFVTIQSFCGAFMVQTYHIDYESMSGSEKVGLWVNCVYMWSGSMIALLVTLGKKKESGQALFDDSLPSELSGKTLTQKTVTQKTEQTVVASDDTTKQTASVSTQASTTLNKV